MAEREKDIERMIVHALKERGWFAIKIANEALYRRRVVGSVAGAPDLVAVGPQGQVLWLEVKRKGRYPSAAQKVVHEELRKRGQEVHVVRSVEEALDLTNKNFSYLCNEPKNGGAYEHGSK